MLDCQIHRLFLHMFCTTFQQRPVQNSPPIHGLHVIFLSDQHLESLYMVTPAVSSGFFCPRLFLYQGTNFLRIQLIRWLDHPLLDWICPLPWMSDCASYRPNMHTNSTSLRKFWADLPGLREYVPYHFSLPRPWNDPCLRWILCAWSLTPLEFEIQCVEFPLIVPSMPLNMDMKMIRSSNSSGLVWRNSSLSWIFLRICNCVGLGKIPL